MRYNSISPWFKYRKKYFYGSNYIEYHAHNPKKMILIFYVLTFVVYINHKNFNLAIE